MGFGKKLLIGSLGLIGLLMCVFAIACHVNVAGERAAAERWILENLEIQENEFAPKEVVDAVRAEYMTEAEGNQKGLSLDEQIAHNMRKTDASERLIAWTHENHHSGIDVDDEKIIVFLDRVSSGVVVSIREKFASAGDLLGKRAIYRYINKDYGDGVTKSLYADLGDDFFAGSNTNDEYINISCWDSVNRSSPDVKKIVVCFQSLDEDVEMSVYQKYMQATESRPFTRSYQGLLDYGEIKYAKKTSPD